MDSRNWITAGTAWTKRLVNDTPTNRHILFITGEYPPLTGGVGAYTERLASALVDLGWNASVLTTARLDGKSDPSPIEVYPRVARWDWRIWRIVPELARQIRADWLHVQYQTAAFGMNPSINLAVERWRKHGFHVAWTYHDLLVPYLFPKAGRRLRSVVTRRPAHFADLTIVTNEGDRHELESSAPHIFRVPIGSNIPARDVSQTRRAKFRQELGYASGDFVIAYFGFLNRSKGGLTLVRTLDLVRRQLPQARLLMVGERVGASDPTNFAYLQEVESLIRDRGLEEAVQWTGRLEDEQVSLALAAADVLFMPYEDGASLRRGTLMAGLANGCAVVTTEPRTSIPELVDGNDLLFVPPGDVQSSATALLRVATDERLCAQLRAGAFAASRQFAWTEIAKIHAGLYESVNR